MPKPRLIFEKLIKEVTIMNNLTTLYQEETALKIEEYKILKHFNGYRNQTGNVLRLPSVLTDFDNEQLTRYQQIQKDLQNINNEIAKANDARINEILENGTPENPYDVLQVLHARFDYKGKTLTELEELKQEARKLFKKYDKTVDYTKFKY